MRTLVASSLNIRDEDFVSNALNFKAEDYVGHGGSSHLASAVSNHGVIETDDAGLVLLAASIVENSGVISSPLGQVGLIAGSEAELKPDISGLRPGLVVSVKADPGEAINYEGGFIAADQGLAGMYGRVVNQEGIIRSISALKKGGRIELFARDTVSMGENSITAGPVSPSSEREHESFQFNPGIINILGLNPVNPNPTDLSREGVGLVGVIEHADLWWKGQNIALDPGTYSYNPPARWGDALSGTAVHNTVSVDGLDQMDRYGKFLWFPWINGSAIGAWRSEHARLVYWPGEHNGYKRLASPAVHRRGILRLPGEHWLVLDGLSGEGSHEYRLQWLLADHPYEWNEKDCLLKLKTPEGRDTSNSPGAASARGTPSPLWRAT